jgi:hypothetical protein
MIRLWLTNNTRLEQDLWRIERRKMGFVQDGRARGEKKGRKVNVSAGEGAYVLPAAVYVLQVLWAKVASGVGTAHGQGLKVQHYLSQAAQRDEKKKQRGLDSGE